MQFPDVHIMVIIITLVFIALDIVSGFIQACVNKCVDSSKMKAGLFHKCGFILAIVLGTVCEWSLSYIDLGFTVPIQVPVCAFICLTEIASILENLGKITPELTTAKFMSIFRRDDK